MTIRKRVYITGGSSGIGLALACLYAGHGGDVILLARDPVKLEEAVDGCRDLATDLGQVIVGESLNGTPFPLAVRQNLGTAPALEVLTDTPTGRRPCQF